MTNNRFLGIFVNPLYIQNEGLQPVFDNLEMVGATAIATWPRLARPAPQGQGFRFPDLHMDGYERLVSRPVWGQHEIYLDYFLAFQPNPHLYQDIPYRLTTKPAPPEVDLQIPEAMINEAHKRGMQLHLMVHPFALPNIRPQEQPVYIDGTTPQGPQINRQACPNNPVALAYGLALVEDTLQHYPTVEGLFIDWAEYGAYRLEDHFTCFCTHCRQQAIEQGFDWDAIERDVLALWRWLHHLTPKKLELARRVKRNPSELLELLAHYPGWLQLLQFKANTITRFYRRVRERLDALEFNQVVLSARGWPPPWNRSSGMDYRALAKICAVVTPKLFTFDYSAMPRWYGQSLLNWNPNLSESIILDALVEWMNLPDSLESRSFAHYHIPAPTEPHLARLDVYRTRLDEVMAQVNSRVPCYPFVHAYLPEPQWKRMLALVRDSGVEGMWVQMYGYLSDRKLQLLKEMWNQ